MFSCFSTCTVFPLHCALSKCWFQARKLQDDRELRPMTSPWPCTIAKTQTCCLLLLNAFQQQKLSLHPRKSLASSNRKFEMCWMESGVEVVSFNFQGNSGWMTCILWSSAANSYLFFFFLKKTIKTHTGRMLFFNSLVPYSPTLCPNVITINHTYSLKQRGTDAWFFFLGGSDGRKNMKRHVWREHQYRGRVHFKMEHNGDLFL